MLWGGNYICGRFLGTALPPVLLNTVRWAISSVLFIIILLLRKQRIPLMRCWKPFALLGFLGVFAFSTLTYLGLQNISASRAGMISSGIPIAILAFSQLLLKEPVKGRAWMGALVSIAGVILLVQGKHGGSPRGSLLGDLEILLSCIAWGLYTVLGKRYGKALDSLLMTAGAAVYGTLFSALACIGTIHANQIHMTAWAWVSVAYVSTFASVLAYLAWTVGVKRVGAGRAAPYINLLPVWAVVFGILLLHEQVSAWSWLGGGVTLLGAAMANF